MIQRRLKISDWRAVFLFSLDGHDKEEVLRQLLDCDPPVSIYDEVTENLGANRLDEGFTYSNPRLRQSVIYVGPTSSGREFLSSFVHELAHLTCDICLADRISLRGEKMAYLQGDIALQLSDVVCKFSCDHCRGD